MTLSQIRRHIVDRASTTHQDWLYRQAPFFGAALAALVPRLYQLYQLYSMSSSIPSDGGAAAVTGGNSAAADGVCVVLLRMGEGGGGRVQEIPPLLLWAVRGVGMATVFALALGMFRQLAVTEYTYKRRYKYSKYFAVRFWWCCWFWC